MAMLDGIFGIAEADWISSLDVLVLRLPNLTIRKLTSKLRDTKSASPLLALCSLEDFRVRQTSDGSNAWGHNRLFPYM